MVALWTSVAWATTMATIPAGSYAPLYPPEPDKPVVEVAQFALDVRPVTAGEFGAFVLSHPKWGKEVISPLLADEHYLASKQPDNEPIVRVSWFAARGYCAAQGKRLPTEDEWEYVARASATEADGSADEARTRQLLAWYGEPGSTPLRTVGERVPNVYGVHDMHGLVWEWVEDYNNTLFGTDGREGGDEEDLRFCGAGALSATDPADYVRFMRVAFRSSLEGRYTTANLGFRCAADRSIP